MAKKALDSVKERLDTPYGIVLVNPAYTEYHVELGEISSYPPGYKENAGIFCHNNPWIMIAETVLGRGDRAFDYYKKITPAYLEDKSEIHRTEPYVYSQMIAGKDAVRHGEAKNSWLTGTAAWNFVAIAHYMLGVRAEYDGLLDRPLHRQRDRRLHHQPHVPGHRVPHSREEQRERQEGEAQGRRQRAQREHRPLRGCRGDCRSRVRGMILTG